MAVGAMAGFAILLSAPVYAQDETIEVSFVFPEAANIPSFSVKDCNFVAPAANGAELVFSCPAQTKFDVSFKNWQTDKQQDSVGIMQIRPNTFDSTVLFAPIYVVSQFFEDDAAADAGIEALEENARPLVKAGKVDVAATNVSATGAKTVVAAAPEEPAPAPVDTEAQIDVNISWDSAYGSLLVNWEHLVIENDEANGKINGVLKWDPSMRSKFVLSSKRSENCSDIFSISKLQENPNVSFECEQQIISLPLELPLVDTPCSKIGEGSVSCLTAGAGKGVALDLPNWKSIQVPAAAADVTEAVTLAQLMPAFPTDVASSEIQALSQDQCTPRKVSLSLAGYCMGDICEDLGEQAVLIGGSGYLADLASVGWDKSNLPTGAKLRLTEITNDGVQTLGETSVSFPTPSQSITSFFRKMAGGGDGSVPLSVNADGGIYKFGRVMKVFKDNECSVSAGTNSLNLSNPGNRVPDVPQCSFYRIFDGNSPRSSCTRIDYDATAKTASANLEVDGCGKQRLVVLVSENETMNGIVGQSIVSALTNLASRLHGEEKCLPVDIVRASGEKREVLLSAEDIKFAEDTSKFQAAVTMSFVNGNSEILRDFEWVNRKWDRGLSGLIAVVDGDNATPTSMVDSPASMAWKIEDKYRSVINFGASKNCNVFQDVLLYDACTEGDAETFEAVLTENIEQGLARLQAE
ncbi:hypothetical protein GCM10007939_22130 [Amylibacter marinus]|uniref:Uncharacterized protein n=1 Tax=Amylibacter marinus TaxID=1475483 RepID=A0ABQ5VXR2_9RHOB|nr:hypothetical protein GCM10007939_22130 [Amylibacter marinus]